MRTMFLMVASALFLAGCATVISKQSLQLVDRGVSFAELRQDADERVVRDVVDGVRADASAAERGDERDAYCARESVAEDGALAIGGSGAEGGRERGARARRGGGLHGEHCEDGAFANGACG